MKIHSAKTDPSPLNPVCLVTGDGRSLFSDMFSFIGKNVDHDVMSIGRSVRACPGRVLHWANVDGPDSKWWVEHLPLKNDGKMPIKHTLGDCEGYDIDWDDGMPPGAPWYGSTALFAVQACLALGYEKVILAGCPLDSNGHFYFPDDKGPEWRPEDYRAWEEFAKTEEAKKVKSLSGFTKAVLGASL